MTSLSLDTYKTISLLQKRGYSKQQAEGLVAVIQTATLADVATRGDITALRHEIATLERAIHGARIEMYKIAAAQTLVIIAAVAALLQTSL